MDILSFITGLIKGKSKNKGCFKEINKRFDEISGERVGEPIYNVTFVNWDGTELCSIKVYGGDDCPDPVNGIINTPTKTQDYAYTYTFSGWSESIDGSTNEFILNKISKDTILYAVYTAEERIYNSGGYCGRKEGVDDVWWKVTGDPGYPQDEKYILHIYGTGRIGEYTVFDYLPEENKKYPSYAGFLQYMYSKISRIIVHEGITELGRHCFFAISNTYTSNYDIQLPSTLRYIPSGAFYNLYSQVSITIPKNVYLIERRAFYNCPKLENIYFDNEYGWTYISYMYGSDTTHREEFPSNVDISDAHSIASFIMREEIDNYNNLIKANQAMYNHDKYLEG